MRRSENVRGVSPGKQCSGILPLVECRGDRDRLVTAGKVPRWVYSRLKRVQGELLLTLGDTLNLLVDLYYRVKNGELVPREKCNSAGGGNGSQ